MKFKLYLVLIISILFIINNIYAFDFDNVKSYNRDEKKYTIENSFGLGGKIADIQLNSEQNELVGVGYRKVAEIETIVSKDYNKAIKKIDFYNKKDMSVIERNFDLKYKTLESIEVNDFYWDCSDKEKDCKYIKTGTHLEEKEVWRDLESYDFKEGDHLVIGIFTDVRSGDYVEWIPTMFGERLTEWASWTSTLNSQLISYYKFDEQDLTGTGTIIDSVGILANGTNVGAINTTGKINTAYDYSGTGDSIDVPINIMAGSDEIALSVWVEPDAAGFGTNRQIYRDRTSDVILGITGGNTLKFTTTTTNGLVDLEIADTNLDADTWNYITAVYNSTHMLLYVNATLLGQIAQTGNILASIDGTTSIGSSQNTGQYWDGKIDELGIFNRSLSSSEVIQLFNSGDGISYEVAGGASISILSPPDDYIVLDRNQSFICVSNSSDVVNISLWSNFTGSWQINDTEEEFGCYQESANIQNQRGGDGNCSLNYTGTYQLITLNGWDSSNLYTKAYDGYWDTYADNVGYAGINVTYIKPQGAVSAIWRVKNEIDEYNITLPDDCFNHESDRIYLRPRVTASGVSSEQWSCWNGSWVDLGNGGKNLEIYEEAIIWNLDYKYTQFDKTINFGDYIWTCQACTNILCDFAENRTIQIERIIINNEEYSAIVTESQTSNFFINVNSTGEEIVSADLVYNGVSYPAIKTGDNTHMNFTRSIEIPLGLGGSSVNFYWEIDYGGYLINSTSHNQIVNSINFTLCNSTLSPAYLNFTFFDELSQDRIDGSQNNTNIEAYFKYWTGNGNVYKNYTLSNLTSSESSYVFCMYPTNLNKTYYVDLDLRYKAEGYSENNYYLRNASFYNTSQNITLYLLDDDEATKFYLYFKKGVADLSDSIINIQKYFIGEGVYKTVSIKLTDSAGSIPIWQDLDNKYKYLATKNGEFLGLVERDASCSTEPCEKTLILSSSSGGALEGYDDIYAKNIISSLEYDNDTGIVTYTFLDTTGLANYFRLEVRKVSYNSTGNIVCNTYAYTTSGTLNCNLSGNLGEFIAKTYISRSPEKEDKLLSILADERVLKDRARDLLFLSLAIVITVCIGAGVISDGNPSTVLLAFGIILLILKIVHLFPYSWIIVSTTEVIVFYIYSKIR